MEQNTQSASVNKLPVTVVITTVLAIVLLIAGGLYVTIKNSKQVKVDEEDVPRFPTDSMEYQVLINRRQARSLATSTEPIQSDDDLIAQSVETIATDIDFKLKSYPQTEFKIKRIALAKGGVFIQRCFCTNATCDPSSRYISVKVNSQPESCTNTNYAGIKEIPAVLLVSLEGFNNSGQRVQGTFIKVMYDTVSNGKTVTRDAPMNPPWAWFGINAFSDNQIPLGFVIPENTTEVRIIYGDYTDERGVLRPNYFEKSEGGFLVKLQENVVTDIPG